MHTPTPVRRVRRLGALGAIALALASLVPVAAVAQEPAGDPLLTVTPTELSAEGTTTVTVTGTGFDPAANVGTRPPLLGQPAGFYVVYGDFDEVWRPSERAPSSARRVLEQRWVLPEAAYESMGAGDELVLLDDDGSFSFSFDLAAPEAGPAGELGVYSYPGSGATNPAHELVQPLTIADDPGTDDPGTDDPDTDDPDTDDPDTDDPDTDDPDTDDPGSGEPGVEQPVAGETGPRPVTDGYADWGVKDSFRAYIEGPIARGTTTTSDGATPLAGGGFRFGAATGSYDPATGEVVASAAGTGGLEVTTRGTVRFQGHDLGDGYALDLVLSDPAITIDGERGTLTLDARSRGLEDPDEVYEGEDVPFAELDLTDVATDLDGDVLTLSAIPATLTEEGADAFAGFYEAGEALDPVTLVLALDRARLPGGDGAGAGDEGGGPTSDDGADAPGPDASVRELPVTGTSVPGLAGVALLLLALGSAVRGSRRQEV